VYYLSKTLAVKDAQAIENKALKFVNTTLLESDLKKRAFCGARLSLAMNLVLITGLHDDNADWKGFFQNKVLEFIGPCTAKLSEPWTKSLLYGEPIDTDMEDFRDDFE
jgi:hypothetical protein